MKKHRRNPFVTLEIPNPFPHLLRAPQTFWVRGQESALHLLEELPEKGLAIVGTRRPQPRSLEQIREQLGALRNTDLIIASGLARGIDSCAHLAALNHGLKTVAFLGTSLDDIYPHENFALAYDIIDDGGLVVSEVPPQEKTQPWRFLMRNRFIAGLTKATWVVAAGERSGALNTAQWALDHGKDLYVTPSFPGDPALAGNQKLLSRGAFPFWSCQDLGMTWPGILSQVELPLLEKPKPVRPKTDSELLTQAVDEWTHSSGGVPLESLLAWATQKKWEPQRFFNALMQSIQHKQVDQKQGVLFAPQSAPLQVT